MEAPKIQQHFELNLETGEKKLTVQYIRADLVDKLIDRIQHDENCALRDWTEYLFFNRPDCTCGLFDLIKEVRG